MTADPAVPAASPWLSHTVRIGEITAEVPGVATYHFEFTDPQRGAAYRFLPGQFNMIYLPGFGESAARYLVNERGVAALGADVASIDYGASTDFVVHQIAAAANVVGFENLTMIARLRERFRAQQFIQTGPQGAHSVFEPNQFLPNIFRQKRGDHDARLMQHDMAKRNSF